MNMLALTIILPLIGFVLLAFSRGRWSENVSAIVGVGSVGLAALVTAFIGVDSSIGNNQQEVLASLREGRSGITFSQELKDSGMRSHVWGNVKLDTTGLIDRKVVRFMSWQLCRFQSAVY